MNHSSDGAAARERGAVLLTGATGFVGMEILARYLERTDRRVFALVRSNDEGEARKRMNAAIECMFGTAEAYADRVVAVPADIARPGLGMVARNRELIAEQVSDIVHCAASVSFSLPIESAREINVDGTRRMLELADLCRRHGGLDHFSYVSTAYVAGTHHGEFREDQFDVGQDFRNPYEQSKFEAERFVRAQGGRLPIQVFRPSIVVGERTTGWTSSFNVLYSPLKAFVRGALPALPARRSSPVDVVPVDYVADAVYELAQHPVDGPETYHLVAGQQASSVGRLIELSANHLGRPQPMVIPPGLFRRLVLPMLARFNARLRQGLERTKVFFPYFSLDLTYENARTRSTLEPRGISVPPLESYFGRLLDYAAAARWGRAPVSRAEAQARVASEAEASSSRAAALV